MLQHPANVIRSFNPPERTRHTKSCKYEAACRCSFHDLVSTGSGETISRGKAKLRTQRIYLLHPLPFRSGEEKPVARGISRHTRNCKRNSQKISIFPQKRWGGISIRHYSHEKMREECSKSARNCSNGSLLQDPKSAEALCQLLALSLRSESVVIAITRNA